MLSKPSSCRGCPLHGDGSGFSEIRGSGGEGVLIVGEALGEDEAKAGKAFVGKTGQLLERIIYRTHDAERARPLDFDRDFWITNIIRCRPPGNKLAGEAYEEEAIRRCNHFLVDTVAELKPRAIVAVGGTALRALTSYAGIDRLRGYTFSFQGIPVVGTFHPSYLVRGKIHLARVVQNDILKAVTIARHGVPARSIRYALHPTAAEAWEYLKAYEEDITRTLAFDIETPWGTVGEKDDEIWDTQVEDNANYTILRISFSYAEHTAITVPWVEPFVSFARRLLATQGPKTVWNGNFDIPRLEANDAPVEGLVVDAMHAWKALEPALPMGLKFVATLLCHDVEAWRLKSTNEPEYYSAADSDILLRCFNKIRQRLIEGNRWEMFHKHFVQLGQILTKISRRGVKVDTEARNSARTKLEEMVANLNLQVQPLVPESLIPKKVFKLPLETLEKKGHHRDQLVLVDAVIPELKKGWTLSQEGYLVRCPKPPKSSRVVKPRAARKKPGSSPAQSASEEKVNPSDSPSTTPTTV